VRESYHIVVASLSSREPISLYWWYKRKLDMMKPNELFFDSGGLRCAADLYWPADPNRPVPCVVMGHGFSGTRDMGLAPYAERFARAGMAVLVFDYRHFGASDGQPR
jgi:fermentation-respiration switch protein FrsA (DUF1100 family)